MKAVLVEYRVQILCPDDATDETLDIALAEVRNTIGRGLAHAVTGTYLTGTDLGRIGFVVNVFEHKE